MEDKIELASNFEDKFKSTIEQIKLKSINIVFLRYAVFNGDFIKRKSMKRTKSRVMFCEYPNSGRIAEGYSYMVNSIGTKSLLKDNIDKIQRTADKLYINENNLNKNYYLLS